MGTGCGIYVVFLSWVLGVVFTVAPFFNTKAPSFGSFLGFGIICLIIAAISTYYYISAPKMKEKAEIEEQLSKQTDLENSQKRRAHMEGLEKYHDMDEEEAHNYQKSIDAMRTLGTLMQQSVYQEKEKDWAILGGIAEGIAGPAAGIVTAANAMKENERIREQNAANREWGAKQNAFLQDLARQSERDRPVHLSMEKLQQKYEVILAWAPATLLSKINIGSENATVDEKTGAVTVTASWSQRDRTICIDGSLRAKLYSSDGKCAGCAYLVFPKIGTAEFTGTLSEICARPKGSGKYDIKIEPVDLWELAAKDNPSSRKNDNLTPEKHRKLVADCDKQFFDEMQ